MASLASEPEGDAVSVDANGVVRLPDGSGAFVAAFPLPKAHWIYAEGPDEPPAPWRVGTEPAVRLFLPELTRDELAADIRAAARYAIRASTMNGKDMDFDPDAMVQNMVVGFLGYWTKDGRR